MIRPSVIPSASAKRIDSSATTVITKGNHHEETNVCQSDPGRCVSERGPGAKSFHRSGSRRAAGASAYLSINGRDHHNNAAADDTGSASAANGLRLRPETVAT